MIKTLQKELEIEIENHKNARDLYQREAKQYHDLLTQIKGMVTREIYTLNKDISLNEIPKIVAQKLFEASTDKAMVVHLNELLDRLLTIIGMAFMNRANIHKHEPKDNHPYNPFPPK